MGTTFRAHARKNKERNETRGASFQDSNKANEETGSVAVT